VLSALPALESSVGKQQLPRHVPAAPGYAPHIGTIAPIARFRSGSDKIYDRPAVLIKPGATTLNVVPAPALSDLTAERRRLQD